MGISQRRGESEVSVEWQTRGADCQVNNPSRITNDGPEKQTAHPHSALVRPSTFASRCFPMLFALYLLPFVPTLRSNPSLVVPGKPAELSLKLDTGASIVWDTDARGHASEFIIRIAQFSPDRHFEWESRAQQGTIRIPAQVLKESRRITFTRLFDNGVDIERADFLTLWLSEKIHQELKHQHRSKVTLDSIQDEFVLLETLSYPLLVDKQPIAVPAIKVKDGRGAIWLFLDSVENPVMLEYQNRYYVQKIRFLTTRGNILRWIH